MKRPLWEDEYEALLELWQFGPLLLRGFEHPAVTQQTLDRLVVAGGAETNSDSFGETRYSITPSGMKAVKAEDSYRSIGLWPVEPD